MLAWDRHLEAWAVAHRTGVLDPLFEGLSYAGTWGLLWLAVGAVAAAAVRRPSLFASAAIADGLGEGVSDALKAAIPRARPHVATLVPLPHTHSFPSGHATVAFACAVALGLALPRLLAPLLVLAAAVAWSRVYVGVHWPLDAIAGALLGAVLGAAVFRTLPRLRAALRRSRREPRRG